MSRYSSGVVDPTHVDAIVPADFDVPVELLTANTVLRPLGPEHNVSDYGAWTSSIDHIRSTPGFGPHLGWPDEELSLKRNLTDLEMHARHFRERVGFTYTILDRTNRSEVVGCLYIYADPTGAHDVEARSWVVDHRAELDAEVWSAVSEWLSSDWPFEKINYAPRNIEI